MLEQFGREFMQWYPNAKVLIATKDDFSNLALAIADKCLTRPDPLVSGRTRGGYP
jgi:N12 class adenine-specific DNA methylase